MGRLGVIGKNELGQTLYGWWVGFHVTDPEMWKLYKAGERPELSIGGRASFDE